MVKAVDVANFSTAERAAKLWSYVFSLAGITIVLFAYGYLVSQSQPDSMAAIGIAMIGLLIGSYGFASYCAYEKRIRSRYLSELSEQYASGDPRTVAQYCPNIKTADHRPSDFGPELRN
jgi:hypothetical protein